MKRAIILIDHGSQRAEANAMLEDVGQFLQRMTDDRVYISHMELASPTLGEAFEAAVGDGADCVFVFPYFLSPGQHSQQDIPRMCREAAAHHPNVKWHCDEPFGLDPKLCEIVLNRLAGVSEDRYQASDG